MFKDEFWENMKIFKNTNLLLDSWYQWIEWDFPSEIQWILIPKKKPRKSKNNPNPVLTKEEKESNRIISSFRIKVENAISWAKRFAITSITFRNKSENFNDIVMELACALWNFHLVF